MRFIVFISLLPCIIGLQYPSMKNPQDVPLVCMGSTCSGHNTWIEISNENNKSWAKIATNYVNGEILFAEYNASTDSALFFSKKTMRTLHLNEVFLIHQDHKKIRRQYLDDVLKDASKCANPVTTILDLSLTATDDGITNHYILLYKEDFNPDNNAQKYIGTYVRSIDEGYIYMHDKNQGVTLRHIKDLLNHQNKELKHKFEVLCYVDY